jgi:urease gamma subunit
MLCLMTGTAGDRAVGTHEISGYICTTYFDMLVDKLVDKPTSTSSRIMSKYRVADNMDAIPGVKFYQYDQSELFINANDINPSHNKWAKDPAKAEAHVKTTLGDLFATKYASGLYPSIREVISEEITGVMMFIPRSTATSDDATMDAILSQIGAVTNEEYYIIELTGRTTKGELAEEYAKKEIKEANKQKKIPLIVSAGHIGSRSFSIPEINVAILMYDGGSAATTGQNMSRPLTRGQRLDKVGHIISVSIDPTRDDSMVEAVLETATKVADETGEDVVEAVKRVLRSMNLHAMNADGEMVAVNPDDYTAKIMNSCSLRKVVGAASKPENIWDNPEGIQILLGMMGDHVTLGKADSIGKKGKTFAKNSDGNVKINNKNDSEEKEAVNLWNKIRMAMKLIADNAQEVAAIGRSDKFTGALNNIIGDAELTAEFQDNFNIQPEFMKELVDTGVINGKLLDLIVYTYNNEKVQEGERFLAEFT